MQFVPTIQFRLRVSCQISLFIACCDLIPFWLNMLKLRSKVSYQCITLINHNMALVQQELMIQCKKYIYACISSGVKVQFSPVQHPFCLNLELNFWFGSDKSLNFELNLQFRFSSGSNLV